MYVLERIRVSDLWQGGGYRGTLIRLAIIKSNTGPSNLKLSGYIIREFGIYCVCVCANRKKKSKLNPIIKQSYLSVRA